MSVDGDKPFADSEGDTNEEAKKDAFENTPKKMQKKRKALLRDDSGDEHDDNKKSNRNPKKLKRKNAVSMDEENKKSNRNPKKLRRRNAVSMDDENENENENSNKNPKKLKRKNAVSMDDENKKSITNPKKLKRKNANLLDDDSPWENEEDEEPKKPMSRPNHVGATLKPQEEQETAEMISAFYEARQMISIAEEGARIKGETKVADGSGGSKRKSSGKRMAPKRFKIDQNNEAAKCLMADALFGCVDVVSVMFSFLDVRQLLRFVCVSKEFKNLLTYDHVVRAAMLSGGFPVTSLERMTPPIRNRKIWIPSPLRLLRTLCGKRCERCESPNRFVCDSFGVFLCRECINGSINLMRRTKQWKEYLDAPRVCLGPQKGSTGHSHMYFMSKPMKDSSGDPIGPLVTFQDFETMANDKDESSITPTEKVAAWMKKCDDQQPRADTAVKAILKALEDNRQDAVKRRATLREVKVEARDKFGKARRGNSDEVMANLMELLKDEHPDIIDQLNTKRWSNRENAYVYRRGSIVDRLLAPVLRAPSKYGAKKKLKQIADQLVLVSGEKRLMDMYLQQIVDHCDHPDTDGKVLRRNYDAFTFRYRFLNPFIRDILKKHFSEPRDLTDKNVLQLAEKVKTIVHRREPGEEVLLKLEERLKGLPFVTDLSNRNWNAWNWSWMFKETYIQDILYEPISKPEDITEVRLDELEHWLRDSMERKKRVHDGMEKLLAPIAKKYPTWHRKLEQWEWNSRDNVCSFLLFCARQLLPAETLRFVDRMGDGEIREISDRLLSEIKKR